MSETTDTPPADEPATSARPPEVKEKPAKKAAATPPPPSVGRTVRYVLAGGCNAGHVRAAIITRTHPLTETDGHGKTLDAGISPAVNLTVLTDKATDYATSMPEEYTRDTPYDATASNPGTWHWPARD